jgi:CRISPR-associated protein Csm1
VGGSTPQQCAVCGREHTDVRPKPVDSGVVTTVNKCPVCESYEELGKQLRKAQFLILEPVEPNLPEQITPQAGKGWQEITRRFGYRVEVLEKLDTDPQGIVFTLNDEAFRERKPHYNRATVRSLLVNVTPILTTVEHKQLSGKVEDLPTVDSVKPLSVLEEQANGIKRVGVLRMDVDNLGKIFAEGLGQHSTLSRIASLSFAVSLFFEGWVGQIAEQMKEIYGDRLYSIYSGGDDLFFVGSWDAVVEFAIRLRSDLCRFTGAHPDIHPSGGIVLVGGKYPLYQSAEEAGEAEKLAKDYQWWENGRRRQKDAIAFLGLPLAWKRFGCHDCAADGENTAHALMHRLEKMVQDNQNRALIGKLIRLHELYRNAQEKREKSGADLNRDNQPQPLWGPWNWLAEYHLSRMRGVPKEEVNDLRERLKQDQFRSIEWIGLAARWAELITRKS